MYLSQTENRLSLLKLHLVGGVVGVVVVGGGVGG